MKIRAKKLKNISKRKNITKITFDLKFQNEDLFPQKRVIIYYSY